MELSGKQEQPKFKDYYKDADIVILAENIGHGKHSDTILSFIDQFSAQLSGILIEAAVSRQALYDKYIQIGEIDVALESFFKGALREGKDLRASTLALLDRAKQYDLPIICYDASKQEGPDMIKKAKHGNYFIKGECRDEDMFNNVANYYTEHPGKYLVIVGGHHMTNENFEGDYKNFGPRMKEAFGKNCVAVNMSDSLDSEDIYDDIILQ